MSHIDADALERAAKAVREIEKSKIAKQVFELSKREAATKAAEEATKQAEYMAQKAAFEKEQEHVRWEEQRKTIKYNTEQSQRIAEFNAESARKQATEEDERARMRNRELVQLQSQADARRESLRRSTEEEIQKERRKTDEFRAALERENMQARSLAEAQGRILERRENEDIFKREMELRGEIDRKRVVEAINTTFSNIGKGFTDFITDGPRVLSTVGLVVGVGAGLYVTREGARVAGRYAERVLGKPSLVRETSRTNSWFSPTNIIKRRMGMQKEADFSDVVLNPKLDGRIKALGTATQNTRRNAAPYRHMMFYGPPGTGKTMVAKRLARSSGMHYAIMTGGDVGPLGRDAVTELHKLFDWAESSRRGLLLFIDEADAFLGSRSRSALSEDQRNALNALLFRTGDVSRKFMMVVATNRPGDLDRAITDRVDEALWFSLPDVKEREKLLHQYFKQYITDAGKESGLLQKRSARIEVDKDVTEDYFAELARRTEGFSGRGLAKLMLSVQGAVYGRQVPIVNKDLMEEVIAYKLSEWADRDAGFHGQTEDTKGTGVAYDIDADAVSK